MLKDLEMWAMAKRVRIGPLEVICRFVQQIGMGTLTGTSNELPVKQNLQISSFDLAQEEVQQKEMFAV